MVSPKNTHTMSIHQISKSDYRNFICGTIFNTLTVFHRMSLTTALPPFLQAF